MSLKRTSFGPHRATTGGGSAGMAITRPYQGNAGGTKTFGGTFQSVRPLSRPKGPSGIARNSPRMR